MKRKVLCIFLICMVTGGLLFAQTQSGRGTGRPAAEKITASGVLGIAKGQIAVQSGDKTYYLIGLNRFIGFIDGLKEGASAGIEGQSVQLRTGENEAYVRVTKLTLNGKDYDLDGGFYLNGGNFFGWNLGSRGQSMTPRRPNTNPEPRRPNTPQPRRR